MNIIHRFLTQNDIDSITKDSNIAFLNALYQCDNIIEVDSNNKNIFSDNELMSFYNYNSSFYLSFIANKESLSDSYLTSRKALYKSIMQIKEQKAQAQKQELDSINAELKDLDSKQREARLNEIQKEQEKKAREFKTQNRFDKNDKSTNDLILQTNDKSRTIIFLDSNGLALKTNSYKSAKLNPNSRLDSSVDTNLNTDLDSKPSMSNLIHIYNENNQTKIDIFTKHNTIIDIYELVKNYSDYGISLDLLHSVNTQIFFYSTLLTGGTESTMPYNECFFGYLDSNDSQNSSDSNNDLDESKPIYYLEYDESDLDSSESYKSNSHSQDSNADSSNQNNNLDSLDSNNSTQTNNKTKIYPTNQTLQVFLNNHRLTILNYSILDSSLNIKLECKSKESKAIQQNEQNKRDKAQIQSSTPSISTAFLCPILECDELK
ncbi:hypothetical protein, partial [Helicobacter sp. T3_23-1056]